MQRARYMVRSAIEEIRGFRDRHLPHLSERLGLLRLKEESVSRLAENPDFLAWQHDHLEPFCHKLRNDLMDPGTVGYANDIIKSVLRVLEPMDLYNTEHAIRRLRDEIRMAEKTRGGQHGSH